MKDKVLNRLFASGGEPISGQRMADELAVSRTAIWKCIKELEEEGYEIGSVRKKGYYLITAPDVVTGVAIQKSLTTKHYGETIAYYESCLSTQPIAHELAQKGATDGTVVVAEEQVSGTGRMARPWVSKAHKGIWMSVITRPNLAPQQAPQMTLVAAVAITRAIEEVTGLTPQIKWPNDLLINGKKVTGILTEMQADPDLVKSIIIGIGINVNQDETEFPAELTSIATSLKIAKGETINRAALIAAVLKYLEQYTDLYVTNGFKPIKLLWESYSNTIGKDVRAVMVRETVAGKAIGITEEGMLQLQLANGTIRGIYSGDIEFNE